MKTLIGKPYIPTDNTFSKCFETNKSGILAGTFKPYRPPVQTIIISEPYKEKVKIGLSIPIIEEHEFINVEYEGKTYKYLYYPENVRILQESDLHEPDYGSITIW